MSGATPTDIAGQAAYTVRVSPKETGSLLGGAELSWDAVHGVPLRAAIYSTTSSSPVLELAATSISYGPVAASVFEFTPPSNAKVEEVTLPTKHTAGSSTEGGERPKLTTHGHGPPRSRCWKTRQSRGRQKIADLPEGLPKVTINGIEATELPTELGTLLSVRARRRALPGRRRGPPAAVEAVARGL